MARSDTTTARLPLPDGLRGLAALGVAAFHLIHFSSGEEIPVVRWGWLGVPVFFVISGFVIPYSMRDAVVTFGYAMRYALRRAIRLDPPLWVTILFVLASNAVLVAVARTPEAHLFWPGWGTLLANFTYLQNLLRLPNLSVGLWTLCIEVQFYLLVLILLRIRQSIPWAAAATFLVLTVCSLWWFKSAGSDDPSVFWNAYRTVFPQFCLFSLGMAACWTRLGRCPPWFFWMIVLGCCAKLAVAFFAELAAAVIAAVVLHLAADKPWLSRRPLGYLGAISYSLYLMHWPAGRWVRLVSEKLDMAGVWSGIVGLAAAVIAADILYRCVERPAHRLSRRIRA